MSETVEELSIERVEEGEVVVKQLDKRILSKGAWATVIYLCEDMDPKIRDYKEPSVRLVRYRKVRGRYTPQSKFHISSAKQAREIAGILQSWFAEEKESEVE